jgi:hypothetical protein
MRTPSKVRCLYLLITLGVTIMVSSPGATAYVIYPTSFATPGDDNGRFLLDGFEPGSPPPSNPDYGFDLSSDIHLPFGTDHPYPFDLYDISDAFFPNQGDELPPSSDYISSDVLSSSNTVSQNPDGTSSLIDSSNFEPISQGFDTTSPSSDEFYPISDPSGNDGFLLAHGHSEPDCDGGVALCCQGVRYLDGSLVENCHYCTRWEFYLIT